MRTIILLIVLTLLATTAAFATAAELNVVTTLPDYAYLAQRIGGERVSVQAIVRGDQDAHFIRPKPSFVNLVRQADVLIDTGLDLEVWLPAVVDKSGNARVRSGRPGYVAAARGMHLVEVPQVVSRIEGGVHLYGNPHVTTSPLNLRMAARNIATGLTTNDPAGKGVYEANLDALLREIDERLFGAELVEMVGGQTLCDLAGEGRLISYLESETRDGQPLLGRLGGWMKELLPLRGVPIVTYHKNWVYFVSLFGIEEAGTIEPKPGIPPSTRHVAELVETMKARHIGVILAANYFDKGKVRGVAEKVGAVPVIVPLYVGGAPGADDTFSLFDLWVRSLLDAAHRSGALGS